MEKPYLKEIEKLGKITVFEVDGNFVRDQINKEFTNFGQHYIFKQIPEFEFWVDQEKSPGEIYYYIDHMLIEWQAMRAGKDKVEAIDRADKLEIRERKKSKIFKNSGIDKAANQQEIIDKIHQKLLKEYSNDSLKVWLIDGELVRDLYDLEFVEGGHDYVYQFIPVNEVWLDNDLAPGEYPFVLLHEIHERYLMATGKTYSQAHRSASSIEHQARLAPQTTAGWLKKEFEKNNKLGL